MLNTSYVLLLVFDLAGTIACLAFDGSASLAVITGFTLNFPIAATARAGGLARTTTVTTRVIHYRIASFICFMDLLFLSLMSTHIF
jgi:hypothetical protein